MEDQPLPFEDTPGDGRPHDLQSAHALYALMLLPKVGSGRAIKLATHFKSWDALLSAPPAAVRSVVGAPIEAARVSVDVDPAEAVGARMVGWFDPEYPDELRALKDPPAVLWVRGQLGSTARVAVVGTRKPTTWGVQVADLVAAAAASRGMTVVSGLALGVDIAAHEAALREGGPTIAVLGGGVDTPSPRRHAEQAERIVATGGALIAEVPPGTAPSARTLVARNRLQAALSRGTVMVQCGLGSGTIHTANFTVQLGRELVVAVPPDTEAEAAENAGNQAMLTPTADADAPRATFALRSVADLDTLFELLGS